MVGFLLGLASVATAQITVSVADVGITAASTDTGSLNVTAGDYVVFAGAVNYNSGVDRTVDLTFSITGGTGSASLNHLDTPSVQDINTFVSYGQVTGSGTLDFSASLDLAGTNSNWAAFVVSGTNLSVLATAQQYNNTSDTTNTYTWGGSMASAVVIEAVGSNSSTFGFGLTTQSIADDGTSTATDGSRRWVVHDSFENQTSWVSTYSNNGGTKKFSVNGIAITSVPEPSTFALLGGLAALGLVIYRRRVRA